MQLPTVRSASDAAARRFSSSSAKDAAFAWLVLLPVFALLALIIYLPALDTFVTSFQFKNLRMADIQEFVGLGNYIKVLGSDEFREVFVRSLLFVAMVLPAETLLALISALLLNEIFPGRGIVRMLILLPWVLPAVVNGYLWTWLLSGDYGALNGLLYQLGILGSYRNWLEQPSEQLMWIGVAHVWSRFSLPMIVLLAGLQFIPDHLYEAAHVDGANVWQRFWNITVPMLLPALALALTVEFIVSFQVFDLVWSMSGGGGRSVNPNTKTLMILNQEMVFRRLDIGLGSALAYLTLFASLAGGFVLVNRLYKTGVR
jgi:ABC-type sugar transport system permease subunit